MDEKTQAYREFTRDYQDDEASEDYEDTTDENWTPYSEAPKTQEPAPAGPEPTPTARGAFRALVSAMDAGDLEDGLIACFDLMREGLDDLKVLFSADPIGFARACWAHKLAWAATGGMDYKLQELHSWMRDR